MWPWGHLAVGYLVYSALVRSRDHRGPGDVPALAVALGTQAPDVVDKPLAWYLHFLPGGRSLAHSLFAVAVVVALALTARRVGHRSAAVTAFAVGYLTHPLADALDPILAGTSADLAFLLWPALSLPRGDGPGSLARVVLDADVTFFFVAQLLLAGLAVAVWFADGRPGVQAVRGWLSRRLVAGHRG